MGWPELKLLIKLDDKNPTIKIINIFFMVIPTI